MDFAALKYKMTDDDVMVVLDTSCNLRERYFDKSKDDVYISNNLIFAEQSEKWNLFEEIIVDGYNEQLLDRLYDTCLYVSRLFFENCKSLSQPYYVNAATDVLTAVLYQALWSNLNSSFVEKSNNLNNEKILELFNMWSIGDFCRFLSTNNKLINAMSLIGTPETDEDGFFFVDENDIILSTNHNSTQMDVFSEIVIVIKELLSGVFAKKGQFSIKKFVRQRGGKTLFLDYDSAVKSNCALIDLALQEAINNPKRGEVFIVIPNIDTIACVDKIKKYAQRYNGLGIQFVFDIQISDTFYYKKLKLRNSDLIWSYSYEELGDPFCKEIFPLKNEINLSSPRLPLIIIMDNGLKCDISKMNSVVSNLISILKKSEFICKHLDLSIIEYSYYPRVLSKFTRIENYLIFPHIEYANDYGDYSMNVAIKFGNDIADNYVNQLDSMEVSHEEKRIFFITSRNITNEEVESMNAKIAKDVFVLTMSDKQICCVDSERIISFESIDYDMLIKLLDWGYFI